MSTNLVNQPKSKVNALIGGSMLIVFGLLALAVNFIEMSGFLFMLIPGAAFMAWGLAMRRTGLVIPGSILTSLAAGIFLVEGRYAQSVEPFNGGVFTLCLASGFFLIALLSLYTQRGRLAWWPLIPGSVLALTGGMMVGGEMGLRMLEVFGQGWPVILIAIGLYLVLRRKDLTQ
jgi:hypothetical protein